jgi:hypothetical protein
LRLHIGHSVLVLLVLAVIVLLVLVVLVKVVSLLLNRPSTATTTMQDFLICDLKITSKSVMCVETNKKT